MDKPGSSAMAAHLRQHHPDEVGKAETMKVEVLQTFSKPLDRQLAESVKIHRSDADILINRKEE